MSITNTDKQVDRILSEVNCQLRNQVDLENTKPSIQRATRFIHDHLYEQKMDVRWIREECEIRSNTFSQRFRHNHGCAPHNYIQNCRIEAAQRLIESGIDDMFEVAMSVGYARYRTFARNFKRLTGCSPTQYQRQME